MKADAPPLLQAGLHHLTSHALKELAVDAFPDDSRRRMLFSKFLAWRDALRQLGVSGTVWLDGSFMTKKQNPDDIDLVFWSPQLERTLTDDERHVLQSLFDKAICRAQYDLDVYIEDPPSNRLIHEHAYWKGMFGFCHDGRTAKGIAEVVI